MTYPRKHKEATMDFFDKMQGKMQAEDIKRRKLSKQSTSSQPELMFLQFKQNHGEQSSGSTPQYMSQQSSTKKTWKPPTKLCPNVPSTMDVGRKSNDEDQLCLSPTFVKYPKTINKTNSSENRIENYYSHQKGGYNSPTIMTTIQENNNKFVKEKTETDGSKLKAQTTNAPVYDLNVCREENKLAFESSHTTSTLHYYDDLKKSRLLSESSDKMQDQIINDECISDQEDIATQQNPNLSKELDSSNGETGSQVQNSGRQSYDYQNKEISDNEDIQLINSIDLILSENQESQHFQSESNSDKYIDNNTPQTDKHSTVVEYQRSENEMSGEFFKAEGELSKSKAISMDIEINNAVSSSEINLEQTQLQLEMDDNKEIESNTLRKNQNKSNLGNNINSYDNETFEINSTKHRVSSVHYDSQNIQQSYGLQIHPDSTNFIENQGKNNDAPSGSIASMNVSDIIQKATKQVKIDSFCRSENDSVGKESSQSAQNQRSEKKIDEKGVNKVYGIKNDEEHGSVGSKESEKDEHFKEKVKYEENKPVKMVDEEDFDGLKWEENKTKDGTVEGVNQVIHPSNQILIDVDTLVADDKDADGNERNNRFQPELHDENKNGFDDDYSCLMISNSQLIELERKYYERPENLNSPVQTTTTQSNNCINHNTRSIGVQTECGIVGILPSNLSSSGLPPTTVSTVQWTNTNQETQRKLRDTIQEVGRLNAILSRIRKELWPRRNVTEANGRS